jgi:hypothetical protein
VGAALWATPAWASSTAEEIAALLDFVAGSGCEMVRNGSIHDAAEARSHLERKLAYLRDRNRIGSAEDFIELAASRSSLSGRDYTVRCTGESERASGDWLRAELARLRAPAPDETGETR